ncbi:DUF2690 domain-containing protein [Streptomyces phaeochromogenes]
MTRTTPSPERARLAAALRDLRTRTGLSMVGLAERTAFSKSSWERYLNGKSVPPRDAVRELCRLASEPEGRCLALWEIAESEWSGRAAHARRTDPPAETPSTAPEPVPSEASAPASRDDTRAGHRGAAVAVLASVCAVVVGGVAITLFLVLGKDAPYPSPSASPSATGPRCRGTACEGRNPMDMKCGVGPQTLASHRTASGAMLELRHSRTCGTSWARMWGTRIGDRLEVTADGHPRSAEVEDKADAAAYVYTPMTTTRTGQVVRACFRPASDGSSDGSSLGKEECFESRVR